MSLDDRSKLRLERINKKGLEVATKLAELKAGKDVSLKDFGLVMDKEDTVEKKERRLRAFLDQINASRTRLNAGDEGNYGKCLACGTEFDDPTLDETPWIERCGDCVAAKKAIAS